MFQQILSRYKSFVYAIMAFFLFLTLQEHVKEAIDACLLPIFDIKYHWALDVFMVLATVGMIVDISNAVKKKSVNLSECACTFLVVFIYGYYRFCDNSYCFVGFFHWKVAYLDVLALYLIVRVLKCLICQEKKFWANKWMKEKKAENVLETVYKHDQKIQSYHEDIFNLEGQIKGILEFLDGMDVSKRSCSIGLVGKWGHGKSSFFELMKRSLEKREQLSSDENTEKSFPEYVVVEFNPRSSKTVGKIQEDFLNAMKEALSNSHLSMTKVFEDYAEALDLSTNTSPVVAFLIRLFNVQRKSWQESFDSIKEVIRLTGKRILVLVDDLDRLTGKELLEVMKVIDKNGAFANVIFVSAYDKEYVNDAICAYLQHKEDCSYTDKYFETEIYIPNHAYFKLREYMLELMKTAHEKGLVNPDKEELGRVMANCDGYLEKRIHSMRDVKRFMNQLLFHYKAVKNDVAFRDYLLLQLIRYAHPDEYDKLRSYEYVEKEGGLSTSAVSDELWYLKPKYNRNSKLKDDEMPRSVDILRALFPTRENYRNGWYDNRRHRIFSIPSFDVYFYNYEYNHLFQKDFDSLYAVSLNKAYDKIKGWDQLKKDLQAYLLPLKIERLGEKEQMVRYFQLLLCAYYLYGDLNYRLACYEFLYKKNVKDIMQKYGMNDRDVYLEWMKESLIPFWNINAYVVAEYLQYVIIGLQEDPSSEDMYEFHVSELQVLATSMLENYLNRIEQENWEPQYAFALSQIRGSEIGKIYEPAAIFLRDSMKQYPQKYISALLPKAVQIPSTKTSPERVKISFTEKFIVKEVFPIEQDFEDWLNDVRLDGIDNVDMIREFWIFYSANDCQPLIAEGTKPENWDELKKMIGGILESSRNQ